MAKIRAPQPRPSSVRLKQKTAVMRRPAAVVRRAAGRREGHAPPKGVPSSASPPASRRRPLAISAPELLNPKGSDQRRVLILYTGGTLGMQDLGNGSLGPVPGALAARLRALGELEDHKMPRCYFIEFTPIIDSADMTPSDWNRIAGCIADAYYDYDGFVVLHGTDTMAYTSSALSFMLEQLAKPVVITGAQIPIFEPVSDARMNFLGSVVFAGLADLSEVCIFFHGTLMRGNRSVKLSASSLHAFGSPCYPPLAELGAPIQIFRRRLREPPRGRFRLQEINNREILVVWVIPGFSDEFLKPLVTSKTLKGMVLLLYGCGNAPVKKKSFLHYLKRLHDQGVVIVACSQCQTGTVKLETYAVGKAFAECGVVSAADMSTEAAVTKLAYLFSKGLSQEQCRRAMKEDMRGELTTEETAFNISEPVAGLSTL